MGCPTLISSENFDKNEVKTVKKKQKQKTVRAPEQIPGDNQFDMNRIREDSISHNTLTTIRQK